MDSLTVRRTAGTLLVVVPLAFTVCFLLLGQLFEYPDILRQPTADVLAKFAAGGTPLVAVWYALTLTAVAFVPVTLLVHRVLAGREAPVLLWVATAFGLIAGLSQDTRVPALAVPGAPPGAGVPGPRRERGAARRRRDGVRGLPPLRRHGRRRAPGLPEHQYRGRCSSPS